MGATAAPGGVVPWRGGQPSAAFPWRIISKLGEGAMGEVYLAEDQELGRKVAIKVVRPGLLSSLPVPEAQAALQRFVQEARTAAALSHPGVPAVHRIGSEGGWPYIVMEWLDGQTLEQILAGRRLSAEQVAWLGLQVLSVLDAAHSAGIVHRDIKPANIVVTRDRRVKVTDFGIAHVHGSNLAHTQMGAILGTPQYAAPEQLAGGSVDGRADIYALGAVLYEALTGRPPFEAANVYELIHRVQTEAPVPPSAVGTGLSRAFDPILLRALSKNPQDRFAMAREMSAVLAPLAAPTKAATASAPARTPPTILSVQTVRTSGASAQAVVADLIRQWPATPLGKRPIAPLLGQLAERPLHAAAFSGALELPGAFLLFYDGVLHEAFSVTAGTLGDEVIDGLASEVDVALRPAPATGDPRAVALLSSILREPVGPSWLDPAVTDMAKLAAKLSGEGFDGALRLVSGQALGFSLFSKGARVLDVFGDGWPASPGGRWEEWIASMGASARVVPRQVVFPSLSFRQQLAECELNIVRPIAPTGALRSDAVAEAHAVRLVPSISSLHRSGSLLDILVADDPAQASVRWLLGELPLQFDQFGRTARWRQLVEALPLLSRVRLHHALLGREVRAFDAVAFDREGRVRHIVERVALGTASAVEDFAARAIAAKKGPARRIDGALLLAPSFDDEAIEAYLRVVRGRRASLAAALSHREGFLRTSPADGFHLLLVEESGERRRPLVHE